MNSNPTKAFIFLVRVPAWILILTSVGMGIFSRRGWLDWQRMEQKNTELETRVGELSEQKDRLERRFRAFRTDHQFQERILRERLGYIRSDEKVIPFE